MSVNMGQGQFGDRRDISFLHNSIYNLQEVELCRCLFCNCFLLNFGQPGLGELIKTKSQYLQHTDQ